MDSTSRPVSRRDCTTESTRARPSRGLPLADIDWLLSDDLCKIEQQDQATADLREFVRQARAEKVSITKIASEAGLSRQGVYGLLGERPSS